MILCRHNSGTDIDESMIWAYDGPMGLWAYDNLMSRDVSVCLEAQEMPRASCPPLHGEERLGHLGQLSLSLGSRTVPRFVVSFHVHSMSLPCSPGNFRKLSRRNIKWSTGNRSMRQQI